MKTNTTHPGRHDSRLPVLRRRVTGSSARAATLCLTVQGVAMSMNAGNVLAESEVIGRIDPPGMNYVTGITFDGDIHPLVVDGYGEVIWRLDIFDASVIATRYLNGGPATTRSLDYDFGSGVYYVSRRQSGVNDTLFTVDPTNGTGARRRATGVNPLLCDNDVSGVTRHPSFRGCGEQRPTGVRVR